MKIILIVVSAGLSVLFILPSIFNSEVNNEVKAVCFYVTIAILLGGLGDVYDWLARKLQNNRDDLKT